MKLRISLKLYILYLLFCKLLKEDTCIVSKEIQKTKFKSKKEKKIQCKEVNNDTKPLLKSPDFIMKPKIDFCFKELMQDPYVRKGFISAILDLPPENILNTRILPSHLERHTEDDKLSILDVRIELNSKQQIDMEMQVCMFDYWTERSTYYLGKMYVDQLGPGDPYDKLEKCIHIGILNFELFPNNNEFYSRFHLREDTNNTLYTDKLEIHVIELPKVKKKFYPDNSILQWTNFFNVENKKELDNMMNKNEYIDKACEQIIKISADEAKRIEYDAREKALRDYNTQMNSNFKKGLEEGLAIGKAEGIEEGIAMGKAEGIEEGIAMGKAEGELSIIIEFYKSGLVSLENALEKSNLTKEQFLEKINK